MTADERLAQVVDELGRAGVGCLVLGGHAVRYYGYARATSDFDLQVPSECWADLPARLARTELSDAPPAEGPSWRPGAFRRFRIGTLADGREEWLEFWRGNHLLPDYGVSASRAMWATTAGGGFRSSDSPT